jgi:hypothetical protein
VLGRIYAGERVAYVEKIFTRMIRVAAVAFFSSCLV